MLGIGIDTGGTCTDAVIYDLDNKKVLASGKSKTTHDHLEIGIQASIRKLPRELVDRASYISLSTTLATNACVENKGGRVCLIFIGMEKKTVDETYQKYGFESTEFMRYLDADAKKGIAPDWNALDEMLPEIFENYDAIAISQLMPRENDGLFEREAKKRILQKKQLPVVCAYEIFTDLNVIKRGAGALLNARLIPVMEEFFQAVHRVLDEERIDLPFFIMRSDGSLVSEQYSMQYPVETLLCGPTASAKGAMELVEQDHAIIIDMGGTTSDVAIVADQKVLVNENGVKVGDWETFVRGIEIDTFALGGDSHVNYKNGKLYLENRRVVPVSTLADEYPQVLEELQSIQSKPNGSTRALYEHFLRVRDITDTRNHYNEQELAIYDALQNGPMGIRQLAECSGTDIFNLKTQRLEDEGVIIRSAFTPTDAMVLRGDRVDEHVSYEAAHLAASFIQHSIKLKVDQITEETYRLVKEKMYCNLVRIMWEHSAPKQNKKMKEQMEATILAYAQEAFAGEQVTKNLLFRNQFCTDSTLIGVGAPAHVFLEDVAKALHTKGYTSEYSGVSNALGALLGDACAYASIYIGQDFSILDEMQVELDDGQSLTDCCVVYGPKKVVCFSWEEAVEIAREMAEEQAKRKVLECGAADVYEVTSEAKYKQSGLNYGGNLLLGVDVIACARGKFL